MTKNNFWLLFGHSDLCLSVDSGVQVDVFRMERDEVTVTLIFDYHNVISSFLSPNFKKSPQGILDISRS